MTLEVGNTREYARRCRVRTDMDEESYPGHFVCEMPMEVRNTQEEGQLWIWICRLGSHQHLRENT